MGYTLFAEVHEGRQASVDSKFQRTYTRVFLVGTDAGTYGPFYAGSHPSLPLIYSSYPEDPYAFCVRLSPSQDQDDPTLWRVTAEYSYNLDLGTGGTGNPAVDAQQAGQAPADRVPNPLLRPRDYSISSGTYPWAVYRARNPSTGVYDKGITNSAGDPFLPPVEIQRAEATITVGLNATSSPSAAWLGSVGCVNSNSMLIGPYSVGVGTVKLNKVSAQFVFENNMSYWRWSLEFGYRSTWSVEILDQGLRELVSGSLKFIRDPATGEKVDQPVLLDGAGAKLASGGTPYFRTFDVYPRVAFTTPL